MFFKLKFTTNNKTLSDKLASLADSQQNWKGGCKENQKGQSSQKGASCYTATLSTHTQNPPSSTNSNGVLPPCNSHQPPAHQNTSTESKTDFRIIWGTQKSVTADSIKACIARQHCLSPQKLTFKPQGSLLAGDKQ